MDLVQRGINCGAIVDPWNLLGFDGNFGLFPAQSNTVRDHRVDDLVELMEQILGYGSQLLSEAAARDNQPLCGRIKLQLHYIANWWHQFAPHEVSSAGAVNPKEIVGAAELVAQAMSLWHQGGAAAGDMAFWAKHAKLFDSPQAYALVIDALMQRDDLGTAMALLIHWLSRAEQIPLRNGDQSFCEFAHRWFACLHERAGQQAAKKKVSDENWTRARRFLELIEANADTYWRIPDFHPGEAWTSLDPSGAFEEVEELPDVQDAGHSSLYDAAYDEMVYRDSTDDGRDDALYEANVTPEDELECEVDRIALRLDFLQTVASLWRGAATLDVLPQIEVPGNPLNQEPLRARRALLGHWVAQAQANREQLSGLLQSVTRYRLPPRAAIPRR